ncbi:hypothetical protein MAQ5080_01280 [Marinomonas aquimarina]|uniref:Uncharacterized protein n=1 Tax=Marinomonas aquimarina TaxID=295068 RepID=A0A1A8T9D9_9GAMM|nr:hypothetical protein MAQ5080_01280 [Marinomonas aquimarina]
MNSLEDHKNPHHRYTMRLIGADAVEVRELRKPIELHGLAPQRPCILTILQPLQSPSLANLKNSKSYYSPNPPK